MSKNFFRKIGFINFKSEQMPTLIQFYRDTLGMKDVEVGQEENSGWYGFETGETTFAIEPVKEGGMGVGTLIQFILDSVEELEEANQYLEKQGVVITARSVTRSYGTFSNFRDPDGNKIELLVLPKK